MLTLLAPRLPLLDVVNVSAALVLFAVSAVRVVVGVKGSDPAWRGIAARRRNTNAKARTVCHLEYEIPGDSWWLELWG